MTDNGNVENILENVNENFDHDIKMQKLKEEMSKAFSGYRKTLAYMSADAPIETLCLPIKTQKMLLNSGCVRIYDLIDLDFTKVKGITESVVWDLTARLNQFLSMC